MIAAGPRPVAPFSHAVEADGLVFVTGQMPTDPEAPDAPLPEGVEAQTRRVIENLKIVLGGVGLELDHVTMARIYLTEFERDYADAQCALAELLEAGQAAGADDGGRHRTGCRRAGRDRPRGAATLARHLRGAAVDQQHDDDHERRR